MRYYPIETKIECTKILLKGVASTDKQSTETWFLFDTGSDVIAIPKAILTKIEAAKIRNVSVKGATGDAQGELYTVNFECGGVRVEGIEVYSSESDYLIGMNFIMRARVGFFFNGNQMIWVA